MHFIDYERELQAYRRRRSVIHDILLLGLNKKWVQKSKFMTITKLKGCSSGSSCLLQCAWRDWWPWPRWTFGPESLRYKPHYQLLREQVRLFNQRRQQSPRQAPLQKWLTARTHMNIISQELSLYFRSKLLANECTGICKAENENCKTTCPSIAVCYECDTELIECIDTCPCRGQCPAGCDGCQNPICLSVSTTSSTVQSTETAADLTYVLAKCLSNL